MNYGQNVDIEVRDKKIIITVDLSAQTTKSASGKSEVIASTHGNVTMREADVKVGVNVYRKAAD